VPKGNMYNPTSETVLTNMFLERNKETMNELGIN
jgi:hypothetical protein